MTLIAESRCGEYAHDFYVAPHRLLDGFGVARDERLDLPRSREVAAFCRPATVRPRYPRRPRVESA